MSAEAVRHGDSKENLEEDLNWLIQDSSSPDASIEVSSTKAKSQPTEDQRHKNIADGHITTTDDETDDDDGLTPAERNLLLQNTLLNDAKEGEDYDVKHRLEEANKALASEGIEEDEEDRERKVLFKPKLVDLEIPPTDSSSSSSSSSPSSSDDEDETSALSDSMGGLDLKKDSSTVEINGQVVRKDEKVLVERGGKFELVEAKDLNGMLSPAERPKLQTTTLPPVKTRPKSAPVKNIQPRAPPRPVSANDQEMTYRTRNQTRTFCYSPETKKLMKQRAALKAQREAEEEKRRKEEEEMARQDAEDAWKHWVERKNDELRQQKKQQNQEARKKNKQAEQEELRKEAEEAYTSWLKQKYAQIKMERIVTQQRQIEVDEGWYLRERRDCNRAFRIWLRNKNEAAKKAKDQEKRLRRQSLKEMRRSRKVQKLMASIREAQQMKYVEYYGYRI